MFKRFTAPAGVAARSNDIRLPRRGSARVVTLVSCLTLRFAPLHGQCLARRVALEGVDDDAWPRSVATGSVWLNPHQVDAAVAALRTSGRCHAILADEGGLMMSIDASLPIG